ncbi:MAG: vanadium-dependent haloperoxidase [Sphingobacteriales bacterium]|nr:vanadium-dependent haloperoxidase [Sphingobacteriales bacterium]
MNLQFLLKRKLFFFLLLPCLTTGITVQAQSKEQTLRNLNNLLVNTVMDDLFTPPVASRIYTYPNIAFYTCIRKDDPSLPDLTGKLNGLNTIPAETVAVDHFIAACISFSYVGQSMVGSEYKFEDWRKAFTDSLQLHADNPLLKPSIKYGKQVADSIIAWSKKDNYLKSRGMPRWVVSSKPGSWQLTPEDYSQAIEPHWNTIRPMTLSNAAQFSPKEKLVYSRDKNSTFYKTMMDVYRIGNTLDSNKKAIAWYWDDNPNVSVVRGHLNYYIHKISPGGHWLMIAQQACTANKETVTRTSLICTLTTIALFDAFISCWDEKFKTNLVRPITVINYYIDKHWKPLIQTPPFPEFTSGHSVSSNSAATILTALLGDHFSFSDETELPFGNKVRQFNSFYEASLESSNSRIYGGIHYPETGRISVLHGKAVGQHVLNILYPAAANK